MMSARWTAWLAVSLWTLSMVFCVCMLILAIAGNPSDDLRTFAYLFFIVASMSTVGTVLAIHRPANPNGWIFILAGLAYAVTATFDRYAYYTTEVDPGALPELPVLFWFGAWLWVYTIFLPATFGILLFPTGSLPSHRWRPFAWLVALSMALWTIADMFSPGPLDPSGDYPQFTNPVAVQALARAFDIVLASSERLGVFLFAGSVASIFFRLRVATAVERQQIKWFAYAAVIPVTGFAFFLLLLALPGVSSQTANFAGEIIVTTGVAILPITIGIAILRHNLYDIDRLINRTLVYGLLTTTLVVTYLAIVLGLGGLVRRGTGESSSLVVAISTLVVAALFRPLRGSIQSRVDRYFYRQKYDAIRTLDTFSERLQDEVDLDALSHELCGVVHETMRPAHISVWLRPSTEGDAR